MTKSTKLDCEVIVPKPTEPLDHIISRWSNNRVQLPAMVVVPNDEHDVVAAINLAKQEGLHLVVGGGGHGSSVSIDSKTLYLDMKNFDAVELDPTAGLLRVGGGVLVGKVIKTCTAKGFYTPWPNSSSIGFAGCVLGGGNCTVPGLYGFIADHVVSIRFIDAEGRVHEVSSSSAGEELKLFRALCGGGYGLGVVTSLVTKAYSLSGLKLVDGDKVWVRRLIFPPTAAKVAADAFLKMQPLHTNMAVSMMFVRGPPVSPAPGAPMVILAASYYGQSHEARRLAAPLFDQLVCEKAVRTETALVPISKVNTPSPINDHGDFKEAASCSLERLSGATIVDSFQKWAEFTEAHEGSGSTLSIIALWNPGKAVESGQSDAGGLNLLGVRERGIGVFSYGWVTRAEDVASLTAFQQGFLGLFRGADSGSPMTYPNNVLPWTKPEELFAPDKIDELKRVKSLWDGSGLFWSPQNQLAV